MYIKKYLFFVKLIFYCFYFLLLVFLFQLFGLENVFFGLLEALLAIGLLFLCCFLGAFILSSTSIWYAWSFITSIFLQSIFWISSKYSTSSWLQNEKAVVLFKTKSLFSILYEVLFNLEVSIFCITQDSLNLGVFSVSKVELSVFCVERLVQNNQKKTWFFRSIKLFKSFSNNSV